MASYKVVFRESIAPDLRAIANKDVARILRRIDELAQNPRPPGSEKLTGEEKCRIRQGACRILYATEDEIVTVTVVKVGHRRNVYWQS